jgi:AraC-like DNA-binding protein
MAENSKKRAESAGSMLPDFSSKIARAAILCSMAILPPCEFDHIVFDSGLVRVGAFRCHPSHPSFHDSGPARNCCFVFPRTAVEIQHEHERAFVTNPNVVTFYNRGQTYRRNPVSSEGDRCEWFGVNTDVVLDVVRTFDATRECRPESPFHLTRGWANANTYLVQRQLFEQLTNKAMKDSLLVEETVLGLLEQVVRSAYRKPALMNFDVANSKQREMAHHVEYILSERWADSLSLSDLPSEVGVSVYHLCRIFRRSTGMTLHQYRQKLRIRWSREEVTACNRSLVDIALDAGFSSHSHFTNSFHREFGYTPSQLR